MSKKIILDYLVDIYTALEKICELTDIQISDIIEKKLKNSLENGDKDES